MRFKSGIWGIALFLAACGGDDGASGGGGDAALPDAAPPTPDAAADAAPPDARVPTPDARPVADGAVDAAPPPPDANACPPGTAGCPCDAGETCGTGLACRDGACASCLDEAGCSCDAACAGEMACDDGACRPAIGCDEILCGDGFQCVEAAGYDGECVEECAPGFVWSPADRQCVDATLCEQIAARCAEENRVCAVEGGAARCDACLDGFVEREGACEPAIRCDGPEGVGEACAALHRACDDDRGDAACGDCLGGWAEDMADPDGACRIAGDPCDAPADCGGGLLCLQMEAPNAGAVVPDGVCATAPCGDGEVWDTTAGECAAVNAGFVARCAEEGGLGVWPVTDFDGNPICHTADGYFFDTSPGERRVKPCDADGDGWVRRTASSEIGEEDLARAGNARCALRAVRAFALENEWGQRREQDLPDGLQRLELYEPDVMDEDGDALAAQQALPAGATGWPAAAVNPLTKACVSRLADVNGNGVEDIAEHHDSAVPDDRAWLASFTPFTHFLELHAGRYEGAAAGELGTWVVAERSRCDDGFPLGYGGDADDWWRSCTRRRPAAYAPAAPGWDFADTSCDAAQGACDPIVARTGALGPGGTPAHGLCAEGLDADPVEWRGMNHASQFRCAQVAANPAETWQISPDDVYTGANDAPLQINRCAWSGEGPACASDPAATLTEAQRGGDTATLAGEVVWTARRYVAYDDAAEYAGGCVNEWVENRDICPGGGNAALGFGNPTQFGRVVCDCDDPGFELPLATNQTGACAGNLLVCTDGALGEPPVGEPVPCNGVDEDCDGEAEEAVAEVCDGIDDDCDGETDEHAGVGFVCVPAGSATIGNGPGAVGDAASIIEAERTATITRDLAVARHEVTRGWMDVTNYATYARACDDASCPIRTEFEEALLYANIASVFEGYDPCYYLTATGVSTSAAMWPLGPKCSGYRLPTSAEWEYAARAGGAWDGDDAGACGPGANVAAVCAAGENPWGLCDVVGNVDEWAWDEYASPPAARQVVDGDAVTLTAETDATGPGGLIRRLQNDGDAGDRREVRGGAAGGDEAACSLGDRTGDTFDGGDHGVRLVRTLPAEADHEAVEPDNNSIDTALDLDPYFDDLGRAEASFDLWHESSVRFDRDYFGFTLSEAAPVRIETVPPAGWWTDDLQASASVEGASVEALIEAGRPAARCPLATCIYLYRRSGNSWQEIAADCDSGPDTCSLINAFDTKSAGYAGLAAGEYRVQVIGFRGDGRDVEGRGRLVVRRRLSQTNGPCGETPTAPPTDPFRPYFPGCASGNTCFDEADAFKTGNDHHENDGLGVCVRTRGLSFTGGNSDQVEAFPDAGGFRAYTFTLDGASNQGVMVRRNNGTCVDVPHMRMRLFRTVNGARVEYADVNNTADRGCLNYAANLPAGTHTALVESLDASAAPGEIYLRRYDNNPE